MPDIVEFLAARLDEDEQIAKDAGFSQQAKARARAWSAEPDGFGEGPFLFGVNVKDSLGIRVFVATGQERADHVARHDPARVLADVAAKRRIIELHEMSRWTWKHQPGVYELPEGFEGPLAEYCTTCSATSREGLDNFYEPWPCDTLKLLAVPHAGQPGYKDQWRP